MDGVDSDVEFEEEWEEVQAPEADTAAGSAVAADAGDITIYLNGENCVSKSLTRGS